VTAAGLRKLGLPKVDPAAVRKMDSTDHIPQIQKVGSTYAKKHVSAKSHFSGF
jgi:hypothetical protein